MIFSADMHGAYVHYVFAMGVVESLVGQGQPAQNNQKNSSQNDWFHIVYFSD